MAAALGQNRFSAPVVPECSGTLPKKQKNLHETRVYTSALCLLKSVLVTN